MAKSNPLNIKFNDFTLEFNARKKLLQQAANSVFSSGWYILGKEVIEFENQLAKYLGVKYCIGVANGLEALQISLLTSGIGQDDEVITTPLSAVATTLAILNVGAKPVFVDTTKEGLIDPDLIEKAITKKTKAILPVHLYGNSIDLSKILPLCHQHHLTLIEDACQAHGSAYQNKKLGTFGLFGCFSFYPTKNLGAFGDGGAIVTNNQRLAKICQQVRDYGQAKKYYHVRAGLNSRLDELQAALLKIKLQFLDQDNQKRRQLAARYLKRLTQIKGLEIIQPTSLEEANCHLLVIKTKKRAALQQYLKEAGIPTLIHYPSLIPDQPFLKAQYGSVKLPIARKLTQQLLSLPCHPFLTLKQVDDICDQVIQFFKNPS